jgi:hypothetical protein
MEHQKFRLGFLFLMCVIFPPAIAGAQPTTDNFAIKFQSVMAKLSEMDKELNSKQPEPGILLAKSELITDLIAEYDSYAKIVTNYNAIYSHRLDSLKQVAIISAAVSLKLSQNNKSKTLALKQLGRIYSYDNDVNYTMRIANALDSVGYKFPYFVHGLIMGLESGTHFAVGGSYAVGYFQPGNRYAREFPRFGGFGIGYEQNPFASYGGVRLSGYFGLKGLGVAFHYIPFATNMGQDPKTLMETSFIAAQCFRPEIGINLGYGQLMVGYNLIGADINLADKSTLRRVRDNYNTWNVAFRFGIWQKIGKKGNTNSYNLIKMGLQRNY